MNRKPLMNHNCNCEDEYHETIEEGYYKNIKWRISRFSIFHHASIYLENIEWSICNRHHLVQSNTHYYFTMIDKTETKECLFSVMDDITDSYKVGTERYKQIENDFNLISN